MSCVCGGSCIGGASCNGEASCGGAVTPVPGVQGYLVAISGVGAPGPKGDPGEPGRDGYSVSYAGTVLRFDDLPASADPGDMWWVETPSPTTAFIWDEVTSGFVGAGRVQGDAGADSMVPGPAGSPGAPGKDGVNGKDGATGATGSKGDKGDVGATGPAGSPGNVGATGAQGIPGPVGAAGPAGGVGPQGEPGKTGAAGPAGAASTVPGPVGATGPAGPKGETGAASTVPGPTGPVGATGPASTVPGPVGPAGPVGSPGADSTVPGPVGPTGPAGVAATVAVGTTTTGAAGTAATVINSGTTSAAVFNFTVPAGVAGIQGVPGVQGPAGLGIQFKGEVPTFADLPTTGQVQGDLWTVASPLPAHGWAWDATTSSWVDAGQIQGPQGIQGPASTVPGPQGPEGPVGASVTGPAGAVGPTGPAGPSVVSKDANNTSVIGTDGLIFTPAASGGSTYVLPAATDLKLGGVKVGSGLAVTADGVLSSTVAGNYLLKTGDVMNGALRFASTGVSSYNSTDVYMFWDGTYFRCRMPGGNQGWIVGTDGGVDFPTAVPSCNQAPTNTGDLTNKAYVDAQISGSTAFLKITGGTMTGTITASVTVPALTFGTSGYNIFGASGGVAIRSNTTNIATFTAANLSMTLPIVTAGTAVGVQFGSGGPTLGKSGTTIASSAPITVAAAPATATELANKKYVDDAIAAAIAALP